ncbi:MAG: hypothetical protein NC301_02660 [Bacteroides sp.]|nr:hypothetical protein [Bacteroides sp.]MCM1379633.1 hypothetical protein [Bacteroides sp.]MCM1445985.1 hypothetical protein [Prevotella sp.]
MEIRRIVGAIVALLPLMAAANLTPEQALERAMGSQPRRVVGTHSSPQLVYTAASTANH